MFNFAAAVSERIRNVRSTKVQPFVPEAEDGFPAEGGGDKTRGYQRGTRSSTSGNVRCISVDSPPGGGVYQLMRGGGTTTGPGARSTGQTSGPETSSRGDEGHIPGDERHLKTPMKKLKRRSFFALRRTPWRPRQTKVQPLNIKASLSTRHHQFSSCAKDSAYGTSFATSSSSFSLKKSKQAEGQVSTAGGAASSPSVNHQVQLGLPSNLRLRRPWTARLRDFLLPRRRRKATAVLPLDKPQGSMVDRQPGSLGDFCDHDNQERHGSGALKARSETRGVKGKKPLMVRSRQGSDDVVTSSKVTPHIDHYQLPGVPQLNLYSKSGSSQDESDNDESGLTLGQEFECVIAGCGDQSYSAVGKYESLPPTTSSASARRQNVMKTSSFASSLKTIDTTAACNAHEDERLDASRSDAACSSSSKNQGRVSDIVLRGDAPSSSVHPTESIKQGVKTREQQLPKAPKLPNREKKEAIFREHRFALGMNVAFIFESFVRCQGYQECRWLDVMQSCIHRKEELRSLVADGNQIVQFTDHELETINMNAIHAVDRIYQLHKLTYEHVKQKKHGVKNVRLFEPVENLPLDEPPASARNGNQTRQEGVRTKSPSPRQQPEAKTATRTTQANTQNTVLTVAREKVKRGVVGTVSKSEDNFLIPMKATLVKRKKEIVIPSMKITSRKLPSSKQNTKGGNRHVSLAKPSDKVNAQNSNKAASPVLVPEVGTSPAAQTGCCTKPTVGTTIPKIAPSCLKKLMPNIPPYPRLDPADLEHVIDMNENETIIGRGDFAEVFLMRRLSDNTLVALKRLKKNHFRVTADLDMLQEVTALQAVRHSSYFPKLYGVVDFRSYAQELLGDGGVDFARTFTNARFQRSLLCRGEWLHVCRDITRALMDLHRVGWLHNDLHTGNAMVCRNPLGSEFKWTGKMIDLGCAHSIYSLAPPWTLTKEQKQSFYQHNIQVAPEVVEGMTSYTFESDVYSLGRLFVTLAQDTSCLSSLRLLGLSCMKRDPKSRPKLKTVYKKINAISAKTTTASNEQPLSCVAPHQ